MKKRNVIGILLYLFGIVLFVISNSSTVSGSPIQLQYVQRVVICSIAVISIGMAPFVYKSKTTVGMIIRFAIAVLLIYCIFIFKGFEDNRIATLPVFGGEHLSCVMDNFNTRYGISYAL
ncbi:hypothetical protein B5E77_13545 [Lachnoclostridium sp. An131]|uniref:hypothetical protein n=1 Tax=Lachnoclostridium sp. An131 TaxID=1965555 RepID=UPI000B386A34|nr:hypothetical protein [Lachnoclostridium sp. An131]OUQ24398.1 hypothetical protein B5E77_13545 [Lachnoclostridium sp. An131]